MPRRLLLTMTIALLTIGCAGLFDSAEPDVSLTLWGGVDRVSVFEVHLGSRRFQLEPEEPAARKEVRAPSTGSVPVRVHLLGMTGDTLAVVTFTRTFHEDHNHWVAGQVGMSRPFGHCIGDLIVTPLPPVGGSAVVDTLFLMHGSIPKGGIC